MRGSTLSFAVTKTYGPFSVNLREKLDFLTLLSLSFSCFLSSLTLTVPFFLLPKWPFSPFFTFIPTFFFSFFSFFLFFPFFFLFFFFFSHLVLIHPNSPISPLPFLLNFNFFSFSLLFQLTFFPLFLHLTHGSI